MSIRLSVTKDADLEQERLSNMENVLFSLNENTHQVSKLKSIHWQCAFNNFPKNHIMISTGKTVEWKTCSSFSWRTPTRFQFKCKYAGLLYHQRTNTGPARGMQAVRQTQVVIQNHKRSNAFKTIVFTGNLGADQKQRLHPSIAYEGKNTCKSRSVTSHTASHFKENPAPVRVIALSHKDDHAVAPAPRSEND